MLSLCIHRVVWIVVSMPWPLHLLCAGETIQVPSSLQEEKYATTFGVIFQSKQMNEMFPHQDEPCNGNEATILLPIYCSC